jgi:hypothetical protein
MTAAEAIESLNNTALAVYLKHDGCIETAKEEIKQLIRANEILLDQAVEQAANASIHKAKTQARRQIEGRKPAEEGETTKEDRMPRTFPRRLRESVVYECGKYFSWPLMDGTPLRAATREHLLEDASRYRGNAHGNLKSALFSEYVAAKVPEGRTVGDVPTLTEKHLAKLMQKAEKAAAEATVK